MDNLDLFQTVTSLNKMDESARKEFLKSVEGEQVLASIFDSQQFEDFKQRQEDLVKSAQVKASEKFKKAYSEPMSSFSVDASKDSAASSSSSIDAC